MKILGEFGREDIAKVYVASMRDGGGHMVEFVESLQPPIPRERKWVLIISSSFGCPVDCLMCDAGGEYHGRLETEELFAQIDHMVSRRFPDGKVPSRKFKVQFARMGEPSFNPCVLETLESLPERYDAPGLIACLSTIAPSPSSGFFSRLRNLKNDLYPEGHFQLQFSIHTTDLRKRDWLIPGSKWDFDAIARFGSDFVNEGDRKITLNFAMIRGFPIDPEVIAAHFDPHQFMVKLTPLNPTSNGRKNGLESAFDPHDPSPAIDTVKVLRQLGFEAIVSVGEPEENRIGSNCGQYVGVHHRDEAFKPECEVPARPA